MADLVERPSEDLTSTIAQLVAAGNHLEQAALYAGVTRIELEDWLDRGEREEKGRFADFVKAIDKAEAEADLRDMAAVASAANDNWQAAAWRIDERRRRRQDEELERLRELTQ